MPERDDSRPVGWLEAKRRRRTAKRELRDERRGRGTKSGDVLADASQSAEASNWSGGWFSSQSSKRR